MGNTDPIFAEAFMQAKLRWEAIITNDLPDLLESTAYGWNDWFAGHFGTAYTAPVDDIAIGYEVGYIDGLYGVLGRAGCRRVSGGRCLSGIMQFEDVDFRNYPPEDVRAIILHEMGKDTSLFIDVSKKAFVSLSLSHTFKLHAKLLSFRRSCSRIKWTSQRLQFRL
jgi:hypothetical protein